MGMVPPPALVLVPPIRAAGFKVMNCVPTRGAMPMMVFPMMVFPMMVLWARTGILVLLLVGMYVMGRSVVGQDCPPAATSWMLASCWGWSVFAMAFVSTVVVLLEREGWMEAVVDVFTCREDTGMLKVWTRSGDCCTGEVAVWAVFCFSRLRHFALLF